MPILFYFILYFILTGGLLLAQQQSPTPLPLPKADQHLLVDEILLLAKQHEKFKELYFNQNEKEFLDLVKNGQNPKILFIGCSDSRVIPSLILNTRPGDLFVIQTAGNFVPPYQLQSIDGVSATVQYAVEVLNVRHIIVCGHSHCGAIQGLFQGVPDNLAILKGWIKLGEKAKQMTLIAAKPSTPKKDLYSTAEEISVILQLENLMTFPFVRNKVKESKLALHGWYFKIETGELWYYDTIQYRFLPLNEKQLIEQRR